LQEVYGSRKVRGCTIIDTPPFFESVGREEWKLLEEVDGGGERVPPLREEEQVIPKTVINGEKDWVDMGHMEDETDSKPTG
jgi:hypothetical protein